ncbi:IS66 family transposase [Paenibacillus popilliae]
MANGMIYGAERWLKSMLEEMKKHLLQQEALHADETTLQVLREPGKSAEATSYLWLYRCRNLPP